MKHSDILRIAKANLRKSADDYRIKTRFICYAIDSVTLQKEPPEVCELFRRISQHLNGYQTFESWLHQTHPEEYQRMSYDDIQTIRHQFVDQLIVEYEQKGM